MAAKEYEIDIDPRILELLGPSLYTNIYYILAELIANAYDANAHNVYVLEEKDGTIVVEDDGNGMSYDEGDIGKYLHVAQETRVSPEQSYVKGSGKKRKKMGRKGVGKLAALSVSEDVEIHTRKGDELSGFILSRHVEDDKKLKGIPEENVEFRRISADGTSIVMKNPQYSLHKGVDVISKNLLKIFPLVDDDFRIHVVRGKKFKVIDNFEEEIVGSLGALVCLGEDFHYLTGLFDSQLQNKDVANKVLCKAEPEFSKKMKLINREGVEEKYELIIKGWIGAYRSSRGRKAEASDFPDNFISLLSNKKLGEFNIIPAVGKNYLNEVYVVGQLHIDLFEETSLPDMALSNRQGYKSDDARYEEVISYVREILLPKILGLRSKYASFVKEQKDALKDQKSREREDTLRKQVDKFKENASQSAAKKIANDIGSGTEIDKDMIAEFVQQAINANFPDMGIKKKVDENKKKILLSHTSADKKVCDFIYDMLVFNGVPREDIIYTNCEHAESRIPGGHPKVRIFDYLRDFFVNSYSTNKIFVLYVTSERMSQSWGAVAEVGAGWITQSKHDVISINDHIPNRPLDVDVEWINVKQDENQVGILSREADKVSDKLIGICDELGYSPKTKQQNLSEINRIANVELPA